MRKKTLLCGLLALVGSAGGAHAQPGLGSPITPETPALDVRPAPRFPILNSIGRNLIAPLRPASPLMPPVETPPTREDIARMIADGTHTQAEILAAKIKMDEAQAKPRQAAVRYLATVDCHYYPEAETGLIAALRADRSESVRFEAAQAMATCRGTTSAMLEALQVSSLGTEADGNPAETSERVRTAARNALNHALASNMSMYPYAPPPMMMPVTDWYGPEYGVMPTYYPLAVQPVTTAELDAAAAAGLPPQPKTQTLSPACACSTNPSNSRSLIEWVQKLVTARESASSGQNADPRMRGLAPLGSESSLSIPAAHANPTP